MGSMLSRIIEIEQIDIKAETIIKPKHCSISLKDKYLEYSFQAKVQDYLEEGVKDGDERIVDTKIILFRESITGVAKRYLSLDRVTEVEVFSVGSDKVTAFFNSEAKADELVNAIINYKLGTQ